MQPQGFVCHELSGHGEDSSEDSEEDDNTKRDQFRRNPLETAKSLGDGVCALVILLCSKHRPGVVEGSGLSERGLAQSWLSESRLLEGSCPKRL